ncbi:unnamed protein product, partial [Rotaria sp. Silwood2]
HPSISKASFIDKILSTTSRIQDTSSSNYRGTLFTSYLVEPRL